MNKPSLVPIHFYNKLHKAKFNRKDEFYTLYETIDKELVNYKNNLIGKIIYCNCDTVNSNFYIWLKEHFKEYNLKLLICTYKSKESYKTIFDGKNEIKEKLIGNGDFRSNECIDLLKQSDVIITNPPFSLLNEFIQLLISYKKDFIILGNQTCIMYKNIYDEVVNNHIRYGYSIHSGATKFIVPKNYNKKGYVDVPGVRWITSFDRTNYKDFEFKVDYDENKYQKYDNYNAINVNSQKEIPDNYFDKMGVPITFLDKYNPNQFKIIKVRKGDNDKDLTVNGKAPYARLIIQRLR